MLSSYSTSARACDKKCMVSLFIIEERKDDLSKLYLDRLCYGALKG